MKLRCKAFGFCLALSLAPIAAKAQNCAQDVERTTALMQKPAKVSPKTDSSGKESHVGTKGGVKQSTQSTPVQESWLGGTHTQDNIAMQNRPAFNPEAATYLRTAARLAHDGQEGGCRQVLVQSERILGIIPADTPLPKTE